jgi:spermidine synthase
VGLAYAWNTAGAIGGALAGGFGLMVWLTALGCWRLVVVLLVALGLAAIVLPWLRGERRWLGSALRVAMAAGALVLVLATTGPTAAWRHSPIGAGRVAHEEVSTPERVDNFLRDARRGLAWDADGIESTISLNYADGYVFTTNGKVDGHCRYDAATQIMGGLLGALLHPAPRTSLVIGLGSGSSAGWLAAVPEMTRVDAVELEPAMLEVARRCAAVNEHALDNPKLHVVLGDAREVLSVTPERYDIVFSEPSNPYRAGVASLYTREFYDRVLQHLKPGGMFLQWVQAYEIDESAMRTIFATAATAFPFVETWQLERADLLLVGSAQPIVKDLEALRARAASEPFARALRQAWEIEDVEGVLAHFVARAEYARSIEAMHVDPLNTDDRPVVEFRFARTVGNSYSGGGDKADTDAVMEAAAARGLGRPELVGAEVDWEMVTLHQAEIPMLDGWAQNYLTPSSDDTHERVMFGRAWKRHEWSEALAQWDRRPREPLTRMEALFVAETAVLAHDPRAHDWVERIAKSHPVEYHALRATMLAQEQHFAEALPELQQAIEGYRRVPWPSRDVMIDAISACDPMASDSSLALRMAEMLVEPFALDMMRDHRLNTLRWLLGWSEVTPRCRELLAPLEPFGDPDRRWTIARSLKYRATCYATTGDPRAREARAEYEKLAAAEDGH